MTQDEFHTALPGHTDFELPAAVPAKPLNGRRPGRKPARAAVEGPPAPKLTESAEPERVEPQRAEPQAEPELTGPERKAVEARKRRSGRATAAPRRPLAVALCQNWRSPRRSR